MDASLVMFFFFICMFFLVIRHLRKSIKNGDPFENEWDFRDSSPDLQRDPEYRLYKGNSFYNAD
jgi:hypothetical protein